MRLTALPLLVRDDSEEEPGHAQPDCAHPLARCEAWIVDRQPEDPIIQIPR